MDANRIAAAESISEFLALWLESDLLPDEQRSVLHRYYSSYVRAFPARIRHYYDRQTLEVADLVGRNPGCRLLEVGCGCGTESLWLALNGARVDGIDLNRERLEVARCRARVLEEGTGRALPVRFMRRSVLEDAGDDRYDVIWMEQAFHHLEPRREVVARLAALLAPGGHLVISEANGWNPLLQLMLLRRRGFRTLKEYVDHDGVRHPYGDERILSARSLRRTLAAAGIRCLGTRHFRVFPNHPRFDALLAFERAVPQALLPLFTHFNYVGTNGNG